MSGGKKRGRASKEKQTPSTSQTSTSSVNDEEDEAGAWDCSVCTFRNKFEAFSCLMCETRKGTSTRKPRLNDNIVAVQKTVHDFTPQPQHWFSIEFTKLARINIEWKHEEQSRHNESVRVEVERKNHTDS
ncbi:hypothetical protein WR25_16344 [Diploscapter pachys]|uniref:RanBP2-type domain-containing protein n=1 Tax=Diploscapter pachys TaxID=2018661 RepID=A0A2A2LB38_9BILA|nr:hypothetical protein WR25_16344 [Diploscapter pachys]